MSVQCQAKMSNDMKESLNNFQKELDIMSPYWKTPEKAKGIANKHLKENPDLEFIGGWGTPRGVLEELEVERKVIKEEKETQRGGKRKGAGRKKGEKTIVMRVPESMEQMVKDLISKHKSKTQ
ncbi:hypothetical protein AB4581_17275 [Vibrio cyclitrophicus]